MDLSVDRGDVFRAACDDYVGSALCILDDSAACRVQGGHHFSPAVEGRFADTRAFLFELGAVTPVPVRKGGKRGFRRFAGYTAVRVDCGIAAKRGAD